MANVLSKQIANWLTPVPFIGTIILYILQVFGLPDNEYETILLVALVVLAAITYRKEKDVRVALNQLDLNPQQRNIINEALKLFTLFFGSTEDMADALRGQKEKVVEEREPTREELVAKIEALEGARDG